MMRTLLVLILLCGTVFAGDASPARSDAESVLVYRKGLHNVIAFAASRHDLFPDAKLKDARSLTRAQKEAVWATWKPFLDYVLALDSVRHAHHGFLKEQDAQREREFLTYYSAFLAQYRSVLEFIQIADRDPGMDTILNDPVPEIGLDRNTYALLKQRFLLNPAKGGGWGALETMYRAMRIRQWPDVRAAIDQDSQFIQDIAKGKGELLAALNAVEAARNLTLDAVFPIQSGVSEWMGDTKVYRPHTSLISQDQIRDMLPKLEPGDVLLERREWYLSNIGLPGFWPHAAMYVGLPEDRAAYFDDPEVRLWVQSQGQLDGSLESFLKRRYPKAYKDSVSAFMGHAPRILEAMSEGVIFTSLEHSAEADSLAVLRPRLSRKEKAIALVRAFHYAGRPYDFDFDFQTDSAIVCTELIFKAYEPGEGVQGLSLPLVEILGRKATPANELVRQFDEQFGAPDQQLDLILFLDGYEKEKRAVVSDLPAFRQSWKRPKWHVLAQK